MVLLAIRVIIIKNGTFKSQHISDNEHLKRKGIRCVIDQDKAARISNRAY